MPGTAFWIGEDAGDTGVGETADFCLNVALFRLRFAEVTVFGSGGPLIFAELFAGSAVASVESISGGAPDVTG